MTKGWPKGRKLSERHRNKISTGMVNTWRRGEFRNRVTALDKHGVVMIKEPKGYLARRGVRDDGCVRADREIKRVSSCFECPFDDCVLG